MVKRHVPRITTIIKKQGKPPQTRKVAVKKEASNLSSIRELDIFLKIIDKLDQAETSITLEKTGNLKLRYVFVI